MGISFKPPHYTKLVWYLLCSPICLQLMTILLSQPEFWNYRNAPLSSANNIFLNIIFTFELCYFYKLFKVIFRVGKAV